jgi:hypothetical protein
MKESDGNSHLLVKFGTHTSRVSGARRVARFVKMRRK